MSGSKKHFSIVDSIMIPIIMTTTIMSMMCGDGDDGNSDSDDDYGDYVCADM